MINMRKNKINFGKKSNEFEIKVNFEGNPFIKKKVKGRKGLRSIFDELDEKFN